MSHLFFRFPETVNGLLSSLNMLCNGYFSTLPFLVQVCHLSFNTLALNTLCPCFPVHPFFLLGFYSLIAPCPWHLPHDSPQDAFSSPLRFSSGLMSCQAVLSRSIYLSSPRLTDNSPALLPGRGR